MSLDTVKAIADAEKAAQQKKDEAIAAGKAAVQKAKTDGAALVAEAVKKAAKEAAELRLAAEEEGQKEAELLADRTENKKAVIRAGAEARMENTAAWIAGQLMEMK